MEEEKWTSNSSEQTIRWAEQLGASWGENPSWPPLLCLRGELGAGKTTCTKGIIKGLTGVDLDHITSPTFTYLQYYEGRGKTVFHFDLYRLSGPSKFLELGFEEWLFPEEEAYCCIEWPDRIEALLPSRRIEVTLAHKGAERSVCLC